MVCSATLPSLRITRSMTSEGMSGLSQDSAYSQPVCPSSPFSSSAPFTPGCHRRRAGGDTSNDQAVPIGTGKKTGRTL